MLLSPDPLAIAPGLKSLTASCIASGSTRSPVQAVLIATNWGTAERPRPSFFADGQLSVPAIRKRLEVSLVLESAPTASPSATASGFACAWESGRANGNTG